jgi:hypothetical protein
MKNKITIPHKIRAQVALRDKFICRRCGKLGIKIWTDFGYFMAFENTFPRPARKNILRDPIYPDDYLISFEIDHIVPESRGGKMVLSNFRLVCRYCNRAKNDRSSYAGKKC